MTFEIVETTDETYSTELFDSDVNEEELDEIDGPFAGSCCDYQVYSIVPSIVSPK